MFIYMKFLLVQTGDVGPAFFKTALQKTRGIFKLMFTS